MPPSPPSRKQPTLYRKAQWLGLAVALAIAGGAVLYIHSRPATPTATPVANAPAKPSAPEYTPKHIYSVTASPTADIAAGLAQARQQHKRVILDFGGDWCGDCQVLDIYFHQAPNVDLLNQNFVLVHVSIGQMDANLDVAAKYGVPINKGVPALAVLAPDGKVLYAQQTGEFEDMRHMDPNSVTDFLEKWKS
jgi:thiol:disulfide interchange protein